MSHVMLSRVPDCQDGTQQFAERPRFLAKALAMLIEAQTKLVTR